jgi:hypothetical protein
MSLTTETQIPKRTRAEINRENAQKSTGPRTEEGKAKSALGALRHGCSSQVVCMPWEDLMAFRSFTASWHEDLKPAGVIETFLTQSLAENAWRMNRNRAMETHVLALAFTTREDKIITENPQVHAALAIADGMPKTLPTLQVLSTCDQRVHKQFSSMLHELQSIQAARKVQEEQDLESAANLMQMHEEANPGPDAAPYDPAEDGFVLHIAQIATFITRQLRRRQSDKYQDKRLQAATS